MRSVGLGEIVELPLPGIGGPSAHRFVGDHLMWLAPADGSLVQALWAEDLRGGGPIRVAGGGGDEASLSHEERLRRERLRERALGITRFSVAGGTLLVPVGGEWWVGTAPAAADLRARLAAPALDARLSPDGQRIAFVRDDELYVGDVAGAGERQLTFGGRGTGRVRGRPEYIAQEEMHRLEGYWWSPDGQFLAYTEVDETVVPIWRIPYNGDPAPRWEDHRYPFAGAQNAAVSLFVVSVEGGEPVKMDLGDPSNAEYLARVGFFPDGSLAVQVQDRLQRRLELRRLDRATGHGRTLRVETAETFVELHDLFHPLSTPGSYLWGSEASGFLHLQRVDADGTVTPLTAGPWVVDALCAVDERRGLVWFLASKDSPRERHLYCVPLAGGEIRRVTQRPGWHSVCVDAEHDRFVDSWSSAADPPMTALCSLADGNEARTLHVTPDRRVDGLAPAVPFTVPGRSGDDLHGLFYRPDGDGPFPTVVFVYGGPHAQRVVNAWDTTIDLRAQHLRSRGIAVMRLDNRGSARRGHAFVAPLYGETGRVEIEDQADAVRALVARGWVDGARVGITGWSYGGYLTIKALVNEPDLFKVGVAGAPVTHWDGYDTHYTERYMGLPAENPDGYARSSALNVAGLRGALMLVHGMLDENVHFRHTGRLVNALVAAGKDFALQVFPDERHMPRKPSDRLYMERRIVDFLIQHLS